MYARNIVALRETSVSIGDGSETGPRNPRRERHPLAGSLVRLGADVSARTNEPRAFRRCYLHTMNIIDALSGLCQRNIIAR